MSQSEDNPDMILLGISLMHIEFSPHHEKTQEMYEKSLKSMLLPVSLTWVKY